MKKATYMFLVALAALLVWYAAASNAGSPALDGVGTALSQADVNFTVGSACRQTSGATQVGGACQLADSGTRPSCSDHWACCCNAWTAGNNACPGENTYQANSDPGTARFINAGCNATYTQFVCNCQGFFLHCYPGTNTLTCPGNKQLLGSTC
jgi:hypothetical protein